MYIPEQFKETNPERISALIENNSFGMLITAPEGVPFVTHLPFLFKQSVGSKGRLLGHMAKANPQWQHFASGAEVLVVFQGPHAYVSPSLHLSSGVPTWNYAVAHLRGKPRIFDDESELIVLLKQLSHVHESLMPNPYELNLSSERYAKLFNFIVGFEIKITDIQAKFILSQNRPIVEQLRVIDDFSQSGDQIEAAVAILMLEAIPAQPK